MAMIKDYFEQKRIKKISKKNDEAYDKIKRAIRYATGDSVTVKLDGSPDFFEQLFNILGDEGYGFKIDHIKGDLLSPDITYLNVKCKRAYDNNPE